MNDNKKKIIKITAGTVTALGAIGGVAAGTTIGIQNTKSNNEKRHYNSLRGSSLSELSRYAKGDMHLLSLPKSWLETGVIPARAFAGYVFPENSVIPPEIKRIENNAFEGAVLSKGFTIPNSVVSVGENIFNGAELPVGFRIPTSWTKIPSHMFAGAKIPEGMTIPSTIKIIENKAFLGATIPNDFKIPPTVKRLGFEVFENAKIGKNFSITLLSNSYRLFKSAIFYGDVYLRGEAIPSSTFEQTEFRGEIHLPKELKTIGQGSFYSSIISGKMEIPSGVTLEKNSFSGSDISGELIIKENCIIKGYAFSTANFSGKLDILYYVDFQDYSFWRAILPNTFELPKEKNISAYAFARAGYQNGKNFDTSKFWFYSPETEK